MGEAGQYRAENNGIKRYPFGMLIQERTYTATTKGYRFGFNGYENEPDVAGDGAVIDFGARIYDSRLGRFFSTDPIVYPYWSPYQYDANSPISVKDVLGMGVDPPKKSDFPKNPKNGDEYSIEDVDGSKLSYKYIADDSMWELLEAVESPATVRAKGHTIEEKAARGNYVYPQPQSNQTNRGNTQGSNSTEPEGVGGFIDYFDELLDGTGKHVSGSEGHYVYSTAKTGKGLYFKPDARGLHNVKGVSVSTSTVLKVTKVGGPIVAVGLEVPEIIDGYELSTKEGNKQVAGTTGVIGGGIIGGTLAGGALGLTGVTTGPGVIVTVFVGAALGSYFGEEWVETNWELLFD